MLLKTREAPLLTSPSNPGIDNVVIKDEGLGASSGMNVTGYMEAEGHEQLCVFVDREAGIRAFIAIHDTTLGPGLGGVRIWPHKTEDDAILDVLRLSKGMTYKAAASGLDFGGGKALIMASPHDKTEAMMRAFGRFVASLGGRYVTTEDVGADDQDLEWIAMETPHVTGLPISKGGSGGPATATALGIYQAMKACAVHLWGSDSLKGRVIAVQGFGKVASTMAHHLQEEGARLVVAEINPAALSAARELGLDVLEDPSQVYDVECDIFSPCALGGILNDQTIPRLKCRAVVGSANNQLLEERHGDAMQETGVLYAPDYIVNAGGIINISMEVGQPYNEEAAMEKVARIHDTMTRVISIAESENISTALAADRLAEERINSMRSVNKGRR